MLGGLAGAGLARAQPIEAGAGKSATDERPGLIALGPFYLTPRLRVGTVGLDTNVFYTAVDRRTDFTASAGPGLELVLPVHSSLRVTAAGGIDYLYFLRTASQRRLTGDGRGRIRWAGPKVEAAVEAAYLRSYGRPSLEVDERVLQQQDQGRAAIRLRLGPRLELADEAVATRLELPGAPTSHGVDLGRTLARDTYADRLTLAYRVTPKTSLLLEGDYQVDRFLADRSRDSASDRLGGGFRIDSKTLLAGRVVGGVRSFRPAQDGGPVRLDPYAQAELDYHFGPRTSLGASYDRDLAYSALGTTPGSTTLTVEAYRVRLEKGLIGRLDLRLFGTLTRLRTHGAITLTGAGGPLTAVRDDRTREGGADLGYVFPWRLRLGVAASYVERRSTFSDFGIQGLLVGATITYKPE